MFAPLVLGIAALASAFPVSTTDSATKYPEVGFCMGDCWTHDPGMIQRESDGMYFRFSTGSGVNTMMSPSLEGPWVNEGPALPQGSVIKLNGVDSMDIWVCKPNPRFN